MMGAIAFAKDHVPYHHACGIHTRHATELGGAFDFPDEPCWNFLVAGNGPKARAACLEQPWSACVEELKGHMNP
jgi:hypothetical protein